VSSDEQQARHPGERQQLRWITRIDDTQQLQVEAFYGASRRFDGRGGVMDEEPRRRGPPTECDEIGFAELGHGLQAAGRRHRSPQFLGGDRRCLRQGAEGEQVLGRHAVHHRKSHGRFHAALRVRS